MKKILLIIMLVFISCSVIKQDVHLHKDQFHLIKHESIIYSHDNEPFDLVFHVKYQIIDTTLSVDSANVLVLDEFDSALFYLIHEHNKIDFFDEDRRESFMDKLMQELWNEEERYLIVSVKIYDVTENH